MGLEDALDAQIAEYEALLAEVKDRNAAIIPDLEWAFLGTGDDFLPHMHDAERFPTVAYNTVLRDLGPTPSAAMVEPTRNGLGFDESFGYAPVSPEVVPDHAADPILVGRYDTLPVGGDLRPALAFTAAGRNGQVFRVDSDIWTSHLVQAERTVLRRIDEILGAGGRNLGDLAAPPAE